MTTTEARPVAGDAGRAGTAGPRPRRFGRLERTSKRRRLVPGGRKGSHATTMGEGTPSARGPGGRHALPGGNGNGDDHLRVAAMQRKAGAQPMASTSTGGGFTPPQTAGGQVRGYVRGADGGGIDGAALTLIDLAGRQVGRGTTGHGGTYRVDTPGAGTFVLIASASAHQPEASTVAVGGGPVDMDIVLTGTSGLLGVVTLAGSAEPVGGATTTLADGRGEVVGAQLTGSDGGYLFTDLVAGDYTLVVSADGHRPVARMVTVPGTGQERHDVELVGGSRLHGTARAGESDRPVVDARITLLDGEGNVVGVTDTDEAGDYSFADLPGGEYTVIASGYPPVASTLRVDGGEHGRHDVELGHPET
jgi:hypothetical protein